MNFWKCHGLVRAAAHPLKTRWARPGRGPSNQTLVGRAGPVGQAQPNPGTAHQRWSMAKAVFFQKLPQLSPSQHFEETTFAFFHISKRSIESNITFHPLILCCFFFYIFIFRSFLCHCIVYVVYSADCITAGHELAVALLRRHNNWVK